jgi:DNA-binding MarR family transcriptional regulator
MPSQEDEIAEARRLSRLLVTAADQAKSRFGAAVEPLGLPVQLARTMLALDAPTSMGELAEQLGFDPSYITGLADQLEERGLIERVPGADRRVKILQPTAAGRALRDQIFAAVNGSLTIAQRLSVDERAILAELLERLIGPDAL